MSGPQHTGPWWRLSGGNDAALVSHLETPVGVLQDLHLHTGVTGMLRAGQQLEGTPLMLDRVITRKSVENIARCMGSRTCGEAVELFAEKREAEPPGEPLRECLHGHQEAALAFMMHGIRPTGPCPECGEIPTFGNAAMSLDFHADGPVKGVDGRVYATCPKCGEDALELEGDSPSEWGWNIACLNCDWTMKQAESLDIAQYCGLMEEVKSKVESINQLMEMPGVTIRTRVESICLQLRMLLELIVFTPARGTSPSVWRAS